MPFRPTKQLESTRLSITGQAEPKVAERLFMATLIKHTIIALAIIIPLAALSAFAAEPVRPNFDKMPTATIATPAFMTQSGLTIRTGQLGYAQSASNQSSSEQVSTKATPQAVDSVDLSRYAGQWYEIGRLPMYFQRKCSKDVTATYTPKAQSNNSQAINVLNQCVTQDGDIMKAIGTAIPVDGTGSKLKVSFLPTWLSWAPFGKADYWILAIDEDYQSALVGTPNKKYLWLLSRQPKMDAQTYQTYQQIAQYQGYDLTAFKPTLQSGR